MTARRLREWPRAVAAAVATVIVLVGLAVLVTGALAGGSHRANTTRTSPSASPTPPANPRQTAALRADGQRIASLQENVARQTAAVGAVNARLRSMLATAQCWHRKATHPIKTRSLHCPVPA